MLFLQAVNVDCETLFHVRKELYENFIRKRFVLKTKDVIKTSIPTNDLKLPKDWKCATIFFPHITVLQIKLNPTLLENHENHMPKNI